ncbi:hypothetical protein Tco_0479377, partial [Tanacetum coccineum]
MGSEAIEVHALKEDEFAQIIILGVHVSFPNDLGGIDFTYNGSLIWRKPLSYGDLSAMILRIASLFYGYISLCCLMGLCILFLYRGMRIHLRKLPLGSSYEPCHLSLQIPLVTEMTHALGFSEKDQEANRCGFPKIDVSNKLTKLATPHSWHQMKESSLAKPNDLIAPGPSKNCPKHVSHQSPREKVGSNDMVHNYYLEKDKKSAQLQKDKEVNGKPSVIDLARLPNTAN